MSKSGYEQFFKAAQEARRSDPQPLGPTDFAPQFKLNAERAKAMSEEQKEDSLRAAFNVKKKKKAKFPWTAAAIMSIFFGAGGFYIVAPEAIENALSKVEFLPFGQAGAAETKAAEKSAAASTNKEKAAAKAGTEKAGPEQTKTDQELADVSHFEKLKERKEELDQREKELNELEEELQRQKVELEKRVVQLEEMRTQIATTLKDRVEVDQEKVNKLVDLYSNMKPKQAADVIGNLNDDLAIEVLAKMKKKSAAEIMNLIPADKARALSEKYTGYRRRVAGS
jgi:flagellar motility protein MotE (MotC chaperone)